MLTDSRKGISGISYNHLNLPKQVTINGKTISYTYDASGTKLQKTSDGVTTDYLDGYQYQNGDLQFFPHAEGYVTGDDFEYVYILADHLGNTRIKFTDLNKSGSIEAGNEILEESNYYPFGLKHRGYNNITLPLASTYKYKYNGKELQVEHELDWYDYGMRFYDPALGRWNVADPVAEWAYDWTPYRYAFNDPINYFDPNGLFETRKEARKYREENNLKGRVRKGADGVYSIDNRKAGTSIWNDSEYGMVTGAFVVADRVEGKVSNLPSDITFKYDPLSSVERGVIDSNVPAIIMHRTVSSVGANLYGAWKTGSKVAGTHFLVGEDGTVYQTGNLTKHTIHLRSGSSKQMYKKYFKKILNSNTVGIEVIGNYNAATKTWDPLTPDQVTAVAHLVLELTFRYDLNMSDVLPHENVQRKTLGEGQVVLDAIKETIQENW